MGWTSILEEVEVVFEWTVGEPSICRLFLQLFIAMLSLCSCRDLEPLPKKVEAHGEIRSIRMTHVVERTYLSGIVGHKNEFVSVPFLDICAQHAFTLRVKVSLVADYMTLFSENRSAFGQRNPREWRGGNNQFEPEGLYGGS